MSLRLPYNGQCSLFAGRAPRPSRMGIYRRHSRIDGRLHMTYAQSLLSMALLKIAEMARAMISVSILSECVLLLLKLVVAAIWQLVGLCRWLVTLLERLLKQCIFVGENELSSNAVIPYPSSAHVGLWTSSDSKWFFIETRAVIKSISRLYIAPSPPPVCSS